MDDDAPAAFEEEEPSAPFWMATFSDMTTLLLTFFIMLVAMSEVEVKKFEAAISYFTGSRGALMEEGGIPGMMAIVGPGSVGDKEETFNRLAQELSTASPDGGAEVDLTERGLRVTLADSVVFDPGSAELTESALRVLASVARAIPDAAAVEVEGHTDDQPISTSAYPSNWELSAGRAASVVRYLLAETDALPAEKYLAVGKGEFHPRASNATAEGRSRNRRITILLLNAESVLPGSTPAGAAPLPLIPVPPADAAPSDTTALHFD